MCGLLFLPRDNRIYTEMSVENERVYVCTCVKERKRENKTEREWAMVIIMRFSDVNPFQLRLSHGSTVTHDRSMCPDIRHCRFSLAIDNITLCWIYTLTKLKYINYINSLFVLKKKTNDQKYLYWSFYLFIYKFFSFLQIPRPVLALSKW